MPLPGKVLSALGGLALSISMAQAASAGGTPGGIDGALLEAEWMDRSELAVDVDLELILAVDVSGSISPDELELERNGYVAAFRDPGLIAAIADGELGGIAVTYFEWAGPTEPDRPGAVVGPLRHRGHRGLRREPRSRASRPARRRSAMAEQHRNVDCAPVRRAPNGAQRPRGVPSRDRHFR